METKVLLKTGHYRPMERMVVTAILALILTAPVTASAGSPRAKADSVGATPSLADSLMADPVKSFERHSFIRDYLDKHLFPDSDKQAMDTFAGPSMAPSTLDHDMLYLSAPGGAADMSLTERRIRESAAKDEAYKVMSNMLFSLKAISRLRDAIEPYTRPLELYRDKDGAISPNYFGQSDGAGVKGMKVFAVNFGISSSHNINVMFSIYDQFNISLLDGTRFIMQYTTAHDDSKIGIETDNSSQLLLTYSLNF